MIGSVEDLVSIGNRQAIGPALARFRNGIPAKIVDYLALCIPIVTVNETMPSFGIALEEIVLEASSQTDVAKIIVVPFSNEKLRCGQLKGTQSVKTRQDQALLEAAGGLPSSFDGRELL